MKRYLLVSDLHAGSNVGVKPKKIITKEETYATTLFPFQRRLYPVWEMMCGEKYDGTIVNGDLVDGTNDKSKGLGAWTTDMHEQASAAASLLKMIKAPKIWIIGGSTYHKGANPSGDRLVVSKLNEIGGNAFNGGDEIVLNIEGMNFHVCHAIGNTFYHGTALNRELIWNYIYKYQFKGLIRSHLHHYHYDSDSTRFAVITPGWKGRDEFLAKFGLRFKPQIGWCVLEINNGEANIKPYVSDVVSKFREGTL